MIDLPNPNDTEAITPWGQQLHNARWGFASKVAALLTGHLMQNGCKLRALYVRKPVQAAMIDRDGHAFLLNVSAETDDHGFYIFTFCSWEDSDIPDQGDHKTVEDDDTPVTVARYLATTLESSPFAKTLINPGCHEETAPC